ncbi:hypothetical protein DFH09DRAFT_95071 [Mycena vulgaris]|nr:hypothetical protein DFH09DRAFT_95071 [Mycena vulgaris]
MSMGCSFRETLTKVIILPICAALQSPGPATIYSHSPVLHHKVQCVAGAPWQAFTMYRLPMKDAFRGDAAASRRGCCN